MKNIVDQFYLHDRVALVTGAGSGLGAHFARILAQAGASIVCVGRRLDPVENVATEIVADGGKAIALSMDVTNTASIHAAFNVVQEQLGPIDILINNAGLSNPAPFEEMSREQWTSLVDANLSGPFYVAQEMAKRLIAAGKPGTIINIASILGHLARPQFLNYGTTKAAVMSMTQYMALDLMPYGIRVNAIAPGYFPSEMTNPFYESEAGKREIASLPIKRLGRHDELNGPLLLLASEAGSYITGSVLTVDAGHSVRLT
ncbi:MULTISPECIES: SDR family NAD(P)-dependent oxidoreductase [Pseudomonas]|uniref:SDR family NAD(P)-dependent oxidoreductase n=1 Tax=Pseudomonas TaxID=286 RepID=UPI001239E66B|nr:MULTISPECIES: SDR family NAD(P)-dependent oxidoreductase [Pseudomonas]QIB51207.1 SDR family oxidoreductase [Pseudomonas sp. OIL-1]